MHLFACNKCAQLRPELVTVPIHCMYDKVPPLFDSSLFFIVNEMRTNEWRENENENHTETTEITTR